MPGVHLSVEQTLVVVYFVAKLPAKVGRQNLAKVTLCTEALTFFASFFS
jgi:hypothetical protein